MQKTPTKELTLHDISKQITDLSHGLKSLGNTVNSLDKKVDKKIDALAMTSSRALDRIEGSIDAVEAEVNGVKQRLDNVEIELHGVRTTVNRIEITHSKKINQLDIDIAKLQPDYRHLSSKK